MTPPPPTAPPLPPPTSKFEQLLEEVAHVQVFEQLGDEVQLPPETVVETAFAFGSTVALFLLILGPIPLLRALLRARCAKRESGADEEQEGGVVEGGAQTPPSTPGTPKMSPKMSYKMAPSRAIWRNGEVIKVFSGKAKPGALKTGALCHSPKSKYAKVVEPLGLD